MGKFVNETACLKAGLINMADVRTEQRHGVSPPARNETDCNNSVLAKVENSYSGNSSPLGIIVMIVAPGQTSPGSPVLLHAYPDEVKVSLFVSMDDGHKTWHSFSVHISLHVPVEELIM